MEIATELHLFVQQYIKGEGNNTGTANRSAATKTVEHLPQQSTAQLQ